MAFPPLIRKDPKKFCVRSLFYTCFSIFTEENTENLKICDNKLLVYLLDPAAKDI